ncbi:uncharacterized protein PHALS_11709 [Plasmopara halstedii]|uniref:Uncharacterized protein n=1 Tax=Plasmopara halstedii TaxID=4781 RepID=A0A0P1AL66_PLAHL|nr:uncharacterized protein PHALS_11709 [Plasmopara halstedii]CEG41359.1 hypothetical protein PHALS_11709 [Plasmopara halstedii]|eukprot:XP_024577728.1 hypothetical protein PHALS_11709 [Plasmopara halstedii]
MEKVDETKEAAGNGSVNVLDVVPTEKADALAANRDLASSMAIPAAEPTEIFDKLEETNAENFVRTIWKIVDEFYDRNETQFCSSAWEGEIATCIGIKWPTTLVFLVGYFSRIRFSTSLLQFNLDIVRVCCGKDHGMPDTPQNHVILYKEHHLVVGVADLPTF